MSPKNPTCPECGAELPSGAPEGLCPRCLIAAGLESEPPHQSPAQAASTTPHSGGLVPPDAEWMVSHFPHLEILELIGSGGMGAVYKARQPRLDRLVALKIIRPEAADSPAFAERFNREARTLARLSHPHIVAVYDFGEVSVTGAAAGQPKSLFYFLMEYVDGATLRELLQTGEMTPPQALAIVPQVCEALQFAHDEGVVHRDIKPENILLDKRGRVKIADFGLAKLITRDPNEFTLTQTHQVMGTPRYMAPEQMEGSQAVDHRADIFSLGVVFYEMLTGEVPAGHFEPPSRKVQVDVRLDEVVLRSLAREPERRYQHASDVKTDVESISGQLRAPAVSPAPPAAVENDSEGSWLGFLGGVAHVVLVVVLSLFGLGILLGGEGTVESLGIPTTGVWVQAAQLAALCLIIAALLSLGYEWKWPRRKKRASDVKTAAPAKVGTPVAHVQLSVPATEDIASRVNFHFVGLGYRTVDERPNGWVFKRGKTAAALYEDDIRLLKTTLTVRAISEDGGRIWINCHWAVRTLGLHWVTRRDVAKLEAEGRALQVMLGGGVEGGELGQVEHDSLLQRRQKPEELVKTPARLLTIAGGILTFWLMLGLGGVMAEGFNVWWPCLVGPVILFAGMSMGQLRAYWLAVVGSLLCLPTAILPIWGWFAFGAGMYTLWRLTQPEVRTAFRRQAMRSKSLSNELNTEPPPRGTLGRAWDDWWAERDQWLIYGVQSVLGIGFFVGLILYISFYSSSERLPDTDGQRLRHTIVTIGVPDPWFKWETYPDKRTPFQWRIDLISTSAGIMLLGFLGWCLNWQIERAKANATGKQLRWWHGAPNFAIAIWGVATVAAVMMGIALAELPQRLDRRSANHNTRPSEQKSGQTDGGEAAATPADGSQATLELTDAAGRTNASSFPK